MEKERIDMPNLKNKLMLDKLTVNNFATFTSQTIHFDSGFNAIVGETGSGKSLILEALQLIFGGRSDKKCVRQGSEFAVIEAIFTTDDKSIFNYFEDSGFPIIEKEIVIKRIVYDSGKSKIFLNHQTTTTAAIIKATRRFVDLVGQFENQKLMSSKYQMVLLDSFAKNNQLLDEYINTYAKITELEKTVETLSRKQLELEQKKDYLTFQISEISKLNPSTEEENELLRVKAELVTLQSELKYIVSANKIISDGEESPCSIEQIKQAIKILSSSKNKDILSQVESLQSAAGILEDVSFTLSKFTDREFDPELLESTVDKLDQYQALKRKFGGTTTSVLTQFTELQNELNSISNVETKLNESKEAITLLTSKTKKIAEALHLSRHTSSCILSEKLTKSVQHLRMEGAQIELKVQKSNNLGPTGFSEISFMAQTNPGEGFHKLSDIASGGELSRILLSMRQILSVNDSISVFLFDEIDTGVGGKTATTIGKALKEVSKDSQVIAITHLPQIAINADKLIEVTKSAKSSANDNIRTESIINEHYGSKVKEHAELMASL